MKKTAWMVLALLGLWGLILSAQAEGRVTIPQSMQIIEDYAFEDCESITELVIPDGVTRIGKGAFKNCENLQSVKIPGSVKNIDDEAFYGCARLTQIALDEGVKTIGEAAFANCASLAEITVPKSMKQIAEGAFSGCENLKQVTFAGDVFDGIARGFLGADCVSVKILKGATNVYGFVGWKALESVEIPDTVTSIG